jgi:hypothetical protein
LHALITRLAPKPSVRGRSAEAAPFLRRELQATERALGERHESTLHSHVLLGLLAEESHCIDEAELDSALAAAANKLGT